VRSDVVIYTLTYGAFYGLLAAGISVTFRATNVFNFAQGGLVMLGGMMTTVFVGMLSGNIVLAGLAALVVVVAVSLATELIAVWPVQRRDPNTHMWVISTLGVSLLIDDIVGKAWDADPRFVKAPFGLSTNRADGPFGMSVYEIVLVVFVIVLLVGLEGFYRTRWGRATLAVAENREAALLRGIRPGAISRLAFMVSGLLAGLAGFLIAPVLYASITLGPLMLIKGFMAAAVGGVGNTRGGLIGGLMIAASEAFTGAYLSPGYQSTITFLILLVVLLVRPTGLFKTMGTARV
jgi:branched-chain amino acid transport system permease protein